MSEIILKPATLADAKMLLQWRNDPLTKTASHDTEDIKFDDHLVWFNKILNDPNRQLYVAWKRIPVLPETTTELIHDAIVAVGTVRADYDILRDCYELSWTVAPEARGKGVGKQMVAILVEQLRDENIRAEIKSDNIGSIKIALYAGMKLKYMDNEGVLHYFRGRVK